MRFQVLGPLSITDGTDAVVLRPSRPTTLLAALLLHAGTVVSADVLQRSVWGADRPGTGRSALQTCVLRLRRLLARYGVTETSIDAVPGGYRVAAGPAVLDLLDFRERVRAARDLSDAPETEAAALREALALWQGPVLANVPSPALHRDDVPRLTEERLRTVERLCDLEMSLGRYAPALPELWSVTRAHPSHERFRERLIEALYRSGRQAEALAEYREIKQHLRDELGVDPCSSLQRLELAILRGDEPEAASRAPEPARPPARAHPPSASVPRTAAAPVTDVPAFEGRVAETAAMTAALGTADGPATLLVSGAPGVGKTALARHVAHRVREHFPGGVTLVRMVRPDGTPRTADEALAVTEAARSRSAERPRSRRLLVLDDVVDADQVRPLLPAGRDAAAAVVTSRRRLAGLVVTHGARVHRLGVFRAQESRALLGNVLGATRVEKEPEAARRLAAVCGHLPLALRIATAWLSTRPGLRLAEVAHWLAENPVTRLRLTDDPPMSLEHVLGTALDRLDPRCADAFLRLGSLPASGAAAFHAAHAAPLLGPAIGGGREPCAETEAVLDRLADAGLLEDGPPGPYRMHALLHTYAQHTAARLRTASSPGLRPQPPIPHHPPQKV
ncbi:BTAD domain-containing putative transcriptional regulator [Streptomyces sp. TR06-5]|uniref:BTAD domain-containing putative transcriptional regulator n=1 Tax=unclassified Streptomyces TaxID=2593676 RepID=UPI0039A239A8